MRIIQQIMSEVAQTLKLNSQDYCDIVNTFGEDTLVLADGSMVSLVQFNGFESAISDLKLLEMFSIISGDLSEIFSKDGYTMTLRFSRNEPQNDRLKQIIDSKKRTARRLGLDLDYILDEQYSMFEDTVFSESITIALTTSPMALDKLDKDMTTTTEPFATTPKDGMNIFAGKSNLFGKHTAFVQKVLTSLERKEFYANAELLDIVEALRTIREMIRLDGTSKTWLPDLLEKDIKHHNLPENTTEYKRYIFEPYLPNKNDISHFVPRSLGEQLLDYGFERPSYEGLPASTLKIGSNLVIANTMQTAPKNPLMFSELFIMLNKVLAKDEEGIDSTIPYAVTFNIKSNARMGVKAMIGSFLNSLGGDNKSIYGAVTALNEMAEKEPIVSIQLSTMTWAKDSPMGAESLKERYLRLSNAVESWGGISLNHYTGDDIKAWRNNILGLSNQFTGMKSLAPLSDALSIMAWNRPLSPFKGRGSILFRSVDGKLTPFEIMSRISNDHQLCVTGSMGSGKSVMLSNLFFEFVLAPRNQIMPKILVVDVGFSAEGMLDLMRNALPPEKRYLAEKRAMKNTANNAVNPFDFKRGLLRPLQSEEATSLAFLNNLLTPPSRPQGIEGASGAIAEIYKETIKLYTDDTINDTRKKKYSVGQNAELDRLMVELRPSGIVVNERMTPTGEKYYEIDPLSVRGIFYKNLSDAFQHLYNSTENDLLKQKAERASILAWRLAMPNLQDFRAVMQDEKFTEVYKQRTDTGDTLIDRLKTLTDEAIGRYDCFSNNTTFDVDSANLLVLDLQNVIDTNNPHHTGLFYQMCFSIFGRNYRIDDDQFYAVVPDFYKNYYKMWNKQIVSATKVMIMDEFKNVQTSPSAMISVEKSSLEFRKHGMTILYAGQLARQFVVADPRNAGAKINLLNTMSYHIELSPPTDTDKELLVESYEIPHEVADGMKNIRRDNQIGSVFYLYCKGANSKYHQYVNNRVGRKMLWVCSTTPIDKTIRQTILEFATSQQEAVEALAYWFGYSAADYMQKELDRISNLKTNEEEKRRLTNSLYEKNAQKALDEYRSYKAQQNANETTKNVISA